MVEFDHDYHNRKVNDGVIQIDSKDLPDGTTVTLLAHEGDETFELDPPQEMSF
jgi:hypothetical protein